MYQLIAKQKIRMGFKNISAGNLEPVLSQFAPNIHFSFAGSHAMSGTLHDLATVREWFYRFRRLFPTLQLVPERFFVSGPPWDMVVTTQFNVSYTLPDGTPYMNRGVQILRIRMGRIVEDHLIEDNQILVPALERLTALGVSEAAAAPLA